LISENMKTLRPLLFAFGALLASASHAAEKKTATSGAPKPYPLDVCIVTDNDLGSMGDEQVMVYEGQTIKFCCKPCEAKFLKRPAKYLAKLAPPSPTEPTPAPSPVPAPTPH
jgi:hypothetical protein